MAVEVPRNEEICGGKKKRSRFCYPSEKSEWESINIKE